MDWDGMIKTWMKNKRWLYLSSQTGDLARFLNNVIERCDLHRLATMASTVSYFRSRRYRKNKVCSFSPPKQELIGENRTIVETVLQILAVQPDACILLCAPSNPATDTLLLRLRNSLKPSEMLRLNDHGRPFNHVPSKLLQFCCTCLFILLLIFSWVLETGYIDIDSAENKFGIPPFRELMKYRVVVCSCVDANILTEAQCTNRTLMRLEDEIMGSIHPHSTARTPAKPHWTHLLIDEVSVPVSKKGVLTWTWCAMQAAQGSEPELCIPINVVTIDAPGPSTMPMSESMQPQLILCGDRYQRTYCISGFLKSFIKLLLMHMVQST